MLKRTSILLLLLTFTLTAQIKVDTLSTTQVGMGIFHTEISGSSVPLTIDVLEIDIKNGYNRVKTVKAKDKLIGSEVVSSMAARNSYAGHTVVGAINGDFYSSGGLPIGTQIVNGEILKYSTRFSTIGISNDKKLSLGRIGFSGEVSTKNGSTLINQINNTRSTNFMVLYNSYMGSATETNQYGTEVLLKPITEWIVNDTVFCVVENIESGVGNMSIPKGYAVLSGHGSSDTFIKDNLSLGDTIKIINKITSSVPKLKEMMGGYPRIVVNGENYADKGYQEEGGPPHTYERHPRTAVGYSQDSSKIYFVTVDGRTSSSQGMTLPELADFLIDAGVYHGLNLDGGGSTTMLVRDKIVNHTSDGSERAVANGILVVSSAPQSDTLSIMQVSPTFLKLFKGERKRISVKGFDKYYNPVDINLDDVFYSVTPGIGEITDDGFFTAGNKSDSGYIYIQYEDFKDSTFVYVKTIGKVQLSPEEVTTDTTLIFSFKVRAWDTDNIFQELEQNEFNWSVENNQIGSIDAYGIFKGKSEGATKIYVNYEEVWDTSIVTVKISEGVVLLNSFDTTAGWQIEGEDLDLNECSISSISDPKSEGAGSMKVVYQYTGNSSKIFHVNLVNEIPIEGVPDSIAVDLKTNGDRHQVIYLIEDHDGDIFQINVKKWANETDFLDVQPGAFENAVPKDFNSIFNFPVSLKEIVIKLGSPRTNGVVFKDSLIIDNLRITYPGSVTDVNNLEVIPAEFQLNQNYPNPFNPTTTIKYSIPQEIKGQRSKVKIKVFDLLGRVIAVLVDGYKQSGTHEVNFDARDLASGVYVYQLKAGNFISSKKMMLLK